MAMAIGGFLLVFITAAFPQHAVPNEIIIKLHPAVALQKESGDRIQILSAAVQAVLQSRGDYLARRALPENFPADEGRYVLLRFGDASLPSSDLISTLQSLPEVESAHYNHVLSAGGNFSPCLPPQTPNDSLFAQQWALQKINAVQAWETSRGSPEVLIAVIDTGVELAHPDLAPNLWINAGEDLNRNGRWESSDENGVDDDGNGFIDDGRGWDFTDAPNFPDGGDHVRRDNDPSDENGHGTAVAGIIAAVADNRRGIAGLAPGCRVMALRAGNSRGLLEEDDVASAIVYAVANGAAIINMSFGDVVVSPMLRDVIRFAHRRGAVLVAAAGNSASAAPHYPASLSETIAVGASTISDRLASFSNYGAFIDITAPGENIWTTASGKTYAPFSGTSAAAPFVAALAGLLHAHAPDFSNDMIRAALHNSARDLGNPGWDQFFGAGRIDAAGALQRGRAARAEIHSPAMDQGFSGLPGAEAIAVRGTALGAFLTDYELHYGAGENPSAWSLIGATSGRQALADSLGAWPLQNLPDGSYTLRLVVNQKNGPRAEDRVRVFVDRTPPVLRNLQLLPMVDGNRRSVLIAFETDDLCHATLRWRPAASAQTFSAVPFNYFTQQHRFNFAQEPAAGEFEFYLEAANRVGLKTRADNGGAFYRLQLAPPEVNSASFAELAIGNLAAGHLLREPADFDRDGWGEIAISVHDRNRSYGPLTIFERTREGFASRFATAFPAIPRDIGDSNGDGRLEILAGLGPRSFIFEAPADNAFPSAQVWADSNDFWAARFADLDADGRQEIIGRRGEKYVVLESGANRSFLEIAGLENFTAGDNLAGAPHAEIADFDGDGRREILLGDGDGDLYLYESAGDNQFAPVWSDRLPLLDSGAFIRALDFDGDGRMDFAAGCHSDPQLNSENEYDARHWLFRLYRAAADNRFETVWEQRFFGMQSPRDFAAGLGSGDVDGDGRDELFLSLFPHGYAVEYENGRARVIWHRQPVRSNTFLAAALEPGGPPAFYFSDGEAVRAFTAPNAQTGPPAPADFEARPLHANAVALSWLPVPGAEAHVIHRAAGDSAARLLAVTSANSFIDRRVISEQSYHYTVATIDSQALPMIGASTPVRTARPSRPPAVSSAWYLPPHHVAVQFNETMSESIRRTEAYRLRTEAGWTQPQSAVVSRSGSEAILAFPQAGFAAGEYCLEVRHVADADFVPLDTAAARASFVIVPEPPRFYLRAARRESPQSIRLQFNLPVDKTSASRAENYELAADAGSSRKILISAATLMPQDEAAVLLHLPQALLKPLGRDYLITAKNIRSAEGLVLQRGEGDAIALALAGENLQRLVIYPNPFLAAKHSLLTIAGLPEQAAVTILDELGRALITLHERDGNGGVDWDTRDQRGRLLPAGVYVCRAAAGAETAWAKFVIVR